MLRTEYEVDSPYLPAASPDCDDGSHHCDEFLAGHFTVGIVLEVLEVHPFGGAIAALSGRVDKGIAQGLFYLLLLLLCESWGLLTWLALALLRRASGKWEKCFFSFLAAFGAFPKHISI